MSALIIIGNGFDLAHGMPTRYSDFRKYLISCYPDIVEYKNYQFDLNDFIDIPEDEFAAELLLSTMDLANGEEWYNFEDALGKIDFSYKFPKFTGDEDSETHDEEMQDYMLAIDIISNCIIHSTKRWQDLFRRWIRSVETGLESNTYMPKDSLKELFSDPSNKYFTFNYTKTLQILYGVKKVTHIHNRVGQNLIFGHPYTDIMYGELSENFLGIGSTFLDDMVMSFRKDTASPVKKYKDFFKSLDHTVDQIYSYGFSYSPVDKIYIKMIIERISPNAIWYFTEHDAADGEVVSLFIDEDNDHNTLEPSVFAANAHQYETFRDIVYHGSGKDKITPDQLQSFMTKNKTEWSMRVFQSGSNISYPAHIRRAIGCVDDE